MDPDLLAALKALSDPQRLRILGRVAGRPSTAESLATELELPLAVVVRHVRVLRSVELVRPDGAARGAELSLRVDTLQGIGRQSTSSSTAPIVRPCRDPTGSPSRRTMPGSSAATSRMAG